jgi:hypothetical protein
MDRSILIRDRELLSSGLISMSRVVVFSDSLEAEECLYKYEIKSEPLLGGIRCLCFCSLSFMDLCSSCTKLIGVLFY